MTRFNLEPAIISGTAEARVAKFCRPIQIKHIKRYPWDDKLFPSGRDQSCLVFNKLGYPIGTARCTTTVEILSNAAQLY